MKHLIFHGQSYSNVHNVGLLIFRLYVGLAMAFGHGLGKMPPQSGFVGFLSSMGVPMPELFAWLAALAEFAGGLFIALGLATRFSSVMLGVTMAVAGFVAHAADPFAKKEMAFLYLASCVLLFAAGAGKFSVDRLIDKRN